MSILRRASQGNSCKQPTHYRIADDTFAKATCALILPTAGESSEFCRSAVLIPCTRVDLERNNCNKTQCILEAPLVRNNILPHTNTNGGIFQLHHRYGCPIEEYSSELQPMELFFLQCTCDMYEESGSVEDLLTAGQATFSTYLIRLVGSDQVPCNQSCHAGHPAHIFPQ